MMIAMRMHTIVVFLNYVRMRMPRSYSKYENDVLGNILWRRQEIPTEYAMCFNSLFEKIGITFQLSKNRRQTFESLESFGCKLTQFL